MIRIMCAVRLVGRVSTDVLWDRLGVVVMIENINQSCLRRYGHFIRQDIQFEVTGKRQKGRPRKSWEECIKKDLERYGLRRDDAYD